MTTLISSLEAYDNKCQRDASYYENNFANASNLELFNLAWARCEKSLGHDDASFSAYERVLLYNPNNNEAIFALIPLYKKMGMDKNTQILLSDVDKQHLTLSQKRELYSLKIKQFMGVTTTFKKSVEYGYDTNLNYNIFTTNSVLPVASTLESRFYAIDIKAHLLYEFSDDSDFSIQSNLELYKKDNKEGSYFDLSYGKLDIGLGYNTSTLSLYIPIVYLRMKYLDRDLYQQIGISPKLTMSIYDELLLNLGLQYTQREYINATDKGANDTMIDASIGVYRFFGDSFIYSQFDYGQNRADASTPSQFTGYKFFHIFAGINYNIKKYDMNLGLDYQYSYRDYDDTIATTTQKRVDEFQQAHLYLKKEIKANWTVKLEYRYLNNNSNYALIDYDKQISSIGLEYKY